MKKLLVFSQAWKCLRCWQHDQPEQANAQGQRTGKNKRQHGVGAVATAKLGKNPVGQQCVPYRFLM
jgi:hypothetical protein